MPLSGNSFPVAGSPFQIAKDETHGTVIVAFADTTDLANPITRFAAIDPSAATPSDKSATVLKTTSTLLADSLRVSDDGTYLYVCERGTCEVDLNQ